MIHIMVMLMTNDTIQQSMTGNNSGHAYIAFIRLFLCTRPPSHAPLAPSSILCYNISSPVPIIALLCRIFHIPYSNILSLSLLDCLISIIQNLISSIHRKSNRITYIALKFLLIKESIR